MEYNNICKIESFRNNAEFYFKLGIKQIERRNYPRAYKHLSKSAAIDAYNADCQFNLACVLAELKQVEKSNEVMVGILKNIDPTLTECYFGIGCNFYELGNFKKAKEYFEKYIFYAPEGQFTDEAYDIISYLQVYEGAGPSKNRSKTVLKLVNEGRELLSSGKHREAAEKLEKAIDLDPQAVLPRNALSLACYFCGDMDKAVSLSKSVLKLEPDNVTANYNLALLYAFTNKNELYREHLKVLVEIPVDDRDELMELFFTYYNNIEDVQIRKFMKSVLDIKQEKKAEKPKTTRRTKKTNE